MRLSLYVTCCLSAAICATAAAAAPVPNGTVSSVATFNPTISLASDPSTYTASNGGTIEVSGTGGFSSIGQTTGTLNGVLSFSDTVGTTIAEALPSFFTFSDAKGGSYNFSISSVQTNSFVNIANQFSSATLYALGNIIDSNLNFVTPTPASLSIQFNSTGGSAYSSALTLAVPPAAVPEPAAWAMLMMGVGAVGAAMRRRKSVTTRIQFA